jgi:hypothetical protein
MVKIDGTNGIDTAQLRAPDGDPVAMTVSNDGKVAFPASTKSLFSANSNSVSIPNTNTETAINSWATPELNQNNGWNPAGGALTPQKAGAYLVTAFVSFGTSPLTGSVFELSLLKNGTQQVDLAMTGQPSGSFCRLTGTVLMTFDGAAEFVQPQVRHNNTAGAVNVTVRLQLTPVGSV